MNGTHTMPAIPPYCREIKTRVEVVEWKGHRLLMREIAKPQFLIEDDLASFQPDLPTEAPGGQP
jgi:hypothetical protein